MTATIMQHPGTGTRETLTERVGLLEKRIEELENERDEYARDIRVLIRALAGATRTRPRPARIPERR